jgi:hypothetical protein
MEELNNMPERHPVEDAVKVAGATLAGAYIGHKIDQTRFGVWFNTNPVINLIWNFIKLMGILFCLYCFGVFCYYLIVQN